MKYYIEYSKRKWAKWADHSESGVKRWHLACKKTEKADHLFDAEIILKENGHYQLYIPRRIAGEPIRKSGTIEDINDLLKGIYPTLRMR